MQATFAALLSCVMLLQPRTTLGTWRAVSLSGLPSPSEPMAAATALVESDCVLILPDAASEIECGKLITAGLAAAAIDRQLRAAGGLDSSGLSRIPTIAAKRRAALVGTPCAAPIVPEADALCEALLLRVMERLDAELPMIRHALFGDASACLRELYRDDALEFSSREPGVNIYREGSEFLPHKDHQALTVLLPLSSPEAFKGGGTGFWHQDARGHRVEQPSVVLRPPAGSALVFGGHVTHAGMPVEAGVRVAYVASFSARGGRRLRESASLQSFDVYGDVI